MWTVVLAVALVSPIVWHAYVVLSTRIPTRHTLSERVATSDGTLLTHRLIHSLRSVLLIIYAIGFLVSVQDLSTIAVMLIAAAAFDITQVLLLKRDHPFGQDFRDPHQNATWAMFISYAIFGTLFTREAGFSDVAVHSIWAVFIILVIITYAMHFRHLWTKQLGYAAFLSVAVFLAHLAIV